MIRRSVLLETRCHARLVIGGFTLIELLVVVAIIALLVAILVPSLNRARQVAQQAVCASHLHQLGIGTTLFAHDRNGRLFRHPDEPLTQSDGWDGNMPNILRTSDLEKISFMPYFSNTVEFFYCPGNPCRANTGWPWPDRQSYRPAWGHPWGGIWESLITFSLLANMPPLNAEDADLVPSKVTDDPELGLWSDCNIWWERVGDDPVWYVANHPGMYYGVNAGTEPRGRNLLRLNGSVTWDEFTDQMKRYYPIQTDVYLSW